MTDCEKYAELISCLADGELSGDESFDLHEHLSVCEDCAAVYAAYDAIADAYAGTAVEPPLELAQNVMNKIREIGPRGVESGAQPDNFIIQPAKRRIAGILKNLTPMAASLLLVVAAGVIVMNMRPGKTEQPSTGIQGTNMELMEAPAWLRTYHAIIVITGALPDYFEGSVKEDIGGKAFRFEADKDIAALLKTDGGATDYSWTKLNDESEIALVVWVPETDSAVCAESCVGCDSVAGGAQPCPAAEARATEETQETA